MLPVSSHCPEVICYLDCKYKVGKGGKNLRLQFGLLLGTLGSWKYCVEAGSLWNYKLGSHSCCVNSYAPIHLLPLGPPFFFNSLISRLSSCKGTQRWEPEAVGALMLGGGNTQVPASLSVFYHLLLTRAGLPRFGRLLPSHSELISLFFCLFFSVSLAQQWWNQGGVGNRTGRAQQLSPKPTPPLMEAMSHVPTPNPRQGPDHLLSLSRNSLPVLFQFFGIHQPDSLAFTATPR